MKNCRSIEIKLEHIQEELSLIIDEQKPNTLFVADDYAENLEAKYQLLEGASYDYEFSRKEFSFKKSDTVLPHSRNRYIGIISPNIYVGTLQLFLMKNNECLDKYVELEVRSVKTGYRDDYRDMLEYITEQSAELLFQVDSPVIEHFNVNHTRDSSSLYQKFSFIKSVILNDEFSEAVNRIVSAPSTKWAEKTEKQDIRKLRRVRSRQIKEIISGTERTGLPEKHYLKAYGFVDIPQKIESYRKVDTVDTAENRFVKYALNAFLKFCSDINWLASKENYHRLQRETEQVNKHLEMHLQHTFFNNISKPETLKINSPILQKKEGYREVLRVWHIFNLASKLVWVGGEDVYGVGKKDIAVLYEYWVFFKLLQLFRELFNITAEDLNKLIQETKDGLNLNLKQGKHTVLRGIYDSGNRKFNFRFHYNRTFKRRSEYNKPGSWSTTLRPDYTISFWPSAISEEDAEAQELIVHIHFDAKYKVANFDDILENESKADQSEIKINEKIENRKGIYKNVDLLKMHAYKDAIRRTSGAYVLYPGGESTTMKGFHEIIPGLGAFPVNPSKTDPELTYLKSFIKQVLEHFCNRISQRERISYKSYEVYKNDEPEILKECAPETYGSNRGLIPDETFVLVAIYKKEDWDWIKNKELFVLNIGNNKGLFKLGPKEAGASYILLYLENEESSNILLKVKDIGPIVYEKRKLIEMSYPSTLVGEVYLVYRVDEAEEELKSQFWNVDMLKRYHNNTSDKPFSVSLTELLKNKKR